MRISNVKILISIVLTVWAILIGPSSGFTQTPKHNPNSNSNSNSNPNPNSNSNPNPDPNSNPNSNPDPNSNSASPKPQDYLHIGETLYLYTTNLKGPLEKDLKSKSFYSFDFPCVEKWEVGISDRPKTSYQLVNRNKKLIYGVKDEMLLWKGFEGADPFFGIESTFAQFVGGMPIYNFKSGDDFDREGETLFYIYYKLENLPTSLQTWALINGYEKLKVKVKLHYTTGHLKTYETTEADGELHELHTIYHFRVDEIKAKKAKRWETITITAHPLLVESLTQKTTTYTGLYNRAHPLGKVKYYEEPSFKMDYLYGSMNKDVPTCIHSGEQIYLYPNPNFGRVNIRMINLPEEDYEFSIYNVVGHQLWQKTVNLDKANSLMSFDLPYLEKGIYLYSIKNARGAYLQSRRLMIVEP